MAAGTIATAASRDELKLRELKRMQAIATGLLVAMAIVFVAASRADDHWPWLAYVRAFAEAAMVGACADWFAVTAIFRRPLGLPIPHTGIIPRNKDRIGEALGGFIADNFLTVDVLDSRLKQIEVARWGGEWLRQPRHARRLARRLSALVPTILKVLPRDMLRETAGSAAVAAIRAVPAAPTASKLLAAFWNEGRSQAAFDWGLDKLAAYLEANEATIQQKVEAKSWKWMPKFIDKMIAQKVTTGLGELLVEMREPDHPWRQELKAWIETFIDRLAHDPELIAKGENLKAKLLADPALREQAAGVWREIEQRLADGDGAGLTERLEQMLTALGEWLHTEETAQARLNEWARILARQVIAPRRHEIGGFVAQVVASWDTKGVVDKLELQVGKDLQYIRVNGTLVGGLVGLAIFSASRAFGL
ncbi:uncharacterized membrane-anchored protein YjiN (DUF445 family) [Phenylobacterium haematophilum]|uniref:Uncharacterized membrane-anchored protein YjiN (DUF445 family) n=1 Tax=Phenylobacterium haematophilum TaxID=98513 RepID=A0A839ZZG2_9CAUL|nr:DUF445 domain-containing protein [Phenylobacterium haematophilum]MBB3891538.1 uncharacterized membrane-anchored protein YjiN (DUF445 family) [Phenylobacterium haematophilum]